MTNSVNAASGLPGAVQELATAVASALDGDDRLDVWTATAAAPDDPVTVAAVRVLGADVLAPTLLRGTPPVIVAPSSVEHACAAYAPATGATPVTVWSHWGMHEALRRTTAPEHTGEVALPGPAGQPDAEWVRALPWQRLSHHLAQLAALAVPGDTALHAAVADRPVDLARGFVRAVRRRDWLQAAGTGRWLTLTPGVPSSLGLAAGLDFAARMGGDDARVALHVHAARLVAEVAG